MHFPYELNIKLSIVVPFPTPSKGLRVGTWRSIFSSAFKLSWSVVDLMVSLVDGGFVHFNLK